MLVVLKLWGIMDKVSKKIMLCLAFALCCSSALCCSGNLQIISEFDKLHKTDFESNLEKIDE